MGDGQHLVARPETPEELSPPKNIRSPARLAKETITDASYSLRHIVKWSSALIDETIPR
jgi:hypothetical protein